MKCFACCDTFLALLASALKTAAGVLMYVTMCPKFLRSCRLSLLFFRRPSPILASIRFSTQSYQSGSYLLTDSDLSVTMKHYIPSRQVTMGNV